MPQNATFELDSGTEEPQALYPHLLRCLSSHHLSGPLCLWDLAAGHKPAAGLGRSSSILLSCHPPPATAAYLGQPASSHLLGSQQRPCAFKGCFFQDAKNLVLEVTCVSLRRVRQAESRGLSKVTQQVGDRSWQTSSRPGTLSCLLPCRSHGWVKPAVSVIGHSSCVPEPWSQTAWVQNPAPPCARGQVFVLSLP